MGAAKVSDFKVGQRVCIYASRTHCADPVVELVDAEVSKCGRKYIYAKALDANSEFVFALLREEDSFFSQVEGYDRYERRLFPSRQTAEEFVERKALLGWLRKTFSVSADENCFSLEQLRAVEGILTGGAK